MCFTRDDNFLSPLIYENSLQMRENSSEFIDNRVNNEEKLILNLLMGRGLVLLSLSHFLLKYNINIL